MDEKVVARGTNVWNVGGLMLVLGCAYACATSGASNVERNVGQTGAEGAPGARKTEQVVQRSLPAGGTAQVAARAEAAMEATRATPSAGAPPRDARSRRTDSINSEHLEAELNRLEAELGR